jgi:hypothetical protein
MDLASMLKDRYPGLASAEFRCFATGADSSSLVEWTEWFQPRLVEYRVIIQAAAGRSARSDTLAGSVVK